MTSPKTLLKAVSAGRARQVRLLLDLGASIDEQDDCGQTPLIKAVLLENDRTRDKILKLLLKRGAQVSQADVVGRNALMLACLNGDNNDVKLLIEYADVDLDYNKVDINGQTGLFHAVTSGNAATVKLIISVLLKYGLSSDVTDYNGTSPLMQAQRLGFDVCESILIFEGNAKIRLNNGDIGNLSRREKWAISSLRDRSKVKMNNRRINRSQFPPISNKVTPRDRTSPNRGKRLESDGEETESEEESDVVEKGSKQKCPTQSPNKPALKPVQVPTGKLSKSNTVTSAASTEIESSGEDSEVDSVASTVIEPGKQRSMKPVVDLATIYNLKQDQMSPSFRQTAVYVEEPEREPTPDVPKLKGILDYLDLHAIVWRLHFLCRFLETLIL